MFLLNVLASHNDRLKKELLKGSTYYNERYKVWCCPSCRTLNRYSDTFGESCRNCGEDHTLDWDKFIVYPEEL